MMLCAVKSRARRRFFPSLLSTLLAVSLVVPVPSRQFRPGSDLLAPRAVPAADLVGEAEKMFALTAELGDADNVVAPVEKQSAAPVWDTRGCKPLGTMLESNPDGSFTLPPNRRVQGFPRLERPKDVKLRKTKDAEMAAKGYVPSGDFYHARPTIMIEERVVENFQDEIAVPRLRLHEGLKKIFVENIGGEIAAGRLNPNELTTLVETPAFRKLISRTLSVQGKTLDQGIQIVAGLAQRLAAGKINFKKVASKQFIPEKPDSFDDAFDDVMQNYLAEDEIIVEGLAAGLNSNGDWASTGFPISILKGHKADFHVLGSDLYGRVVKVGSKIAQLPVSEGGYRVGEMVVFQTGIHGVLNPQAHGGHPFKLKSAHIIGYEDPVGTFTDFYKYHALAFMRVSEEEVLRRVQMVTDEGAVVPGAPAEVMASYGLVLPTVEHALNRLGVAKNSILIMEGGSGGTGRYGIQAAKARGAYVIAIVSDDKKGKAVLNIGADAFINRKNNRLVQVEEALGALKQLRDTVGREVSLSSLLDPQASTPPLADAVNEFLKAVSENNFDEAVSVTPLAINLLRGTMAVYKQHFKESRPRAFDKADQAIQVMTAIEKYAPGFVNRSIRVLNGSATYEDMEVVHEDYLKQVQQAVRGIIRDNQLVRVDNLADAVINFMGTQTFGRHAMSVRKGNPLDPNDLGGVTGSFGGGSGFKVQFPGAGSAMHIEETMARVQRLHRRSQVKDHIDNVLVFGATEGAKHEVEEMLSIEGRKVLVVVKNDRERDTVLGWNLLRKGVDGIINAGGSRTAVVDGTLDEKKEQLQRFKDSPFEKRQKAIFVKNDEEQKALTANGLIDPKLDKVYSEKDTEIIRDLSAVTPEGVEKIRRTGRYVVVAAKTPAEKKTVLSWKFWYERGMFVEGKDVILETWNLADLETPMPDTPVPLPYSPTEEEMKGQAARDKAYSNWFLEGVKPVENAMREWWGTKDNPKPKPDLIFGRAKWPAALAHCVYLLDNFGLLVMRGPTENQVYSFDIRHFWMSQKIILMPRQALIGTHYASVKECHDAHDLVRKGVIRLSEVNVFPWEKLGEAQENMGNAKNVILIGAPQAGLKTVAEVRQANVKRFVAMLGSEKPEERELAARQLHYLADAMADAAVETYKDSPELQKLIYKPATCGVCVEPETFEKIRAAWGVSKESVHSVEHQNAREFELHLEDGAHLDILTVIDRNKESALTDFLNKQGEGIQQVELFVPDVKKVMELLSARAAAGKGSKPAWDEPKTGTTGTPVNFNLVKLPDGRKVLVEFVEMDGHQQGLLRRQKLRTDAVRFPLEAFPANWLEAVRASLESAV